jgi:hypothetical protein
MTTQKELATDYFDRHQVSNECHITSDDRVFHTKGSAESFASTLSNKEIVSFTRNSIKKSNPVDEVLHSAKVKELHETDLVKENYQALKDFVKFFKIEVPDQKSETLITALTDFKLKLQE